MHPREDRALLHGGSHDVRGQGGDVDLDCCSCCYDHPQRSSLFPIPSCRRWRCEPVELPGRSDLGHRQPARTVLLCGERRLRHPQRRSSSGSLKSGAEHEPIYLFLIYDVPPTDLKTVDSRALYLSRRIERINRLPTPNMGHTNM